MQSVGNWALIRLVQQKWQRRHTLVTMCFAAVFVCYIDRVNISVAVLAMQESLRWSETVKGLVLSSFFLGYLIFQIPSGYLANRFGGRRVLGSAVWWWSLCTVLTPAAALWSLPALIAIRIAMGLGEAAMFPSAYSLFSRAVPQAERTRSVSLLMSGIPLGTLFGLSAAGWIVSRYDWPAVFYIFGGLGVVWAVLWFALTDEDPVNPTQSHATAIPWKRLLDKPAVWALIVNHFCSNWTLYLLLAWLPSYFRNALHLSITSAGLFSAAPWLTMLVMINVAAWIADALIRRGVSLTAVRKIMQVAGLMGSAAFLFLAKDATDPTSALVLMCGALGALALTWSGFMPNHLDIAPRYAGVLMGITNTAGTIPGMVGVAVTGWLVDTSGTYASAFMLAAAVSVFGALVWLAFGTGKRVLE